MIKLRDILAEFDHGRLLWADPAYASSSGRYRAFIEQFINESKVELANQKIDDLPKGATFEDAKRIDSIFNKSKHTWSEVIEAFESGEKDAKVKSINVKDIQITQPNIQANKVKRMIAEPGKLPVINAVQFSDGISIYDGHHRLMTSWAIGETKIKVNLVKA
jgi:hypothetical protein